MPAIAYKLESLQVEYGCDAAYIFCEEIPLTSGFPQDFKSECLKEWAHEIHNMSLVVRETLLVELPAVETEDKQA